MQSLVPSPYKLIDINLFILYQICNDTLPGQNIVSNVTLQGQYHCFARVSMFLYRGSGYFTAHCQHFISFVIMLHFPSPPTTSSSEVTL